MIKDLIFDVGMNRGEDTAFYISQGYRVVAVEADPILVMEAKKRFSSEVHDNQLHIIDAAIAQEAGSADFYICEAVREWNSFDKEVASRSGNKYHRIKVNTIRFDTILEKYGIPVYMKIDIEGNDHLCLGALHNREKPPYISIESECVGGGSFATAEKGLQSLELLRQLGYRRFKLIQQNTFCALLYRPMLSNIFDRAVAWTAQMKMNSRISPLFRLMCYFTVRRRLQKRFMWTFPFGSSGVWGDYTQGPWMSFDQASKAYRIHRNRHFANHWTVEPHSFWCDWHAAR